MISAPDHVADSERDDGQWDGQEPRADAPADSVASVGAVGQVEPAHRVEVHAGRRSAPYPGAAGGAPYPVSRWRSRRRRWR